MKELAYLNKFFVRYKWHFSLGILFVLATNYFKMRVPGEIGVALDYILSTAQDLKNNGLDSAVQGELRLAIMKYGATILGFALLMGFFMYFTRQTLIVMSRLIEYDLRKELFDKYEHIDISFFKRNKTGDLMARISEDVSKVRMYIGPAVLYGLNLVALFVLVISAMLNVSATLTFYTLLPLPLLSISIYLVSSVINKKSTIIQQQLSKLNSIAQEVYSGIRVVKSYVKEDQFSEYFLEQSNDYRDKSLSLARVNALFYPVMILLISASTLLTVVIGGVQVSKGLVSPGTIAEFVIYVNMLTWPVTSIGWIASIVQQAAASQKRINEFLSTESELIQKEAGKSFSDGKVVFEDVSFTYPDSGIEALKNISFQLNPGQKLAVIGKTASGKSTLADLLLRMFDVTSGRILIDDINIKDLSLDDLRRKIGYVPQESFLFSDTVNNNVAFGRNEATKEEIVQFTKHTAVYDDIMGLQDQFETRMGERGVTLSGGQKQRISIARALIKNPDLVILDDSLSAVDTKTEQKVLDYLNGALKNKTSIIITHRAHNLLDYDKIIMLEGGKIIEIGSHQELLDKKGQYFELIQLQLEERENALV